MNDGARCARRTSAAWAVVAAASVLAACVTKRPTYAAVPSEVIQRSGFAIHRPSAIVDPKDLRFHGWVCRKWTAGFAPGRLRIERLDAAGNVTARAYGGIHLAVRPECTTYDIWTNWDVSSVGRVRLCAADGEEPCRSPP